MSGTGLVWWFIFMWAAASISCTIGYVAGRRLERAEWVNRWERAGRSWKFTYRDQLDLPEEMH